MSHAYILTDIHTYVHTYIASDFRHRSSHLVPESELRPTIHMKCKVPASSLFVHRVLHWFFLCVALALWLLCLGFALALPLLCLCLAFALPLFGRCLAMALPLRILFAWFLLFMYFALALPWFRFCLVCALSWLCLGLAALRSWPRLGSSPG